MEERNKTNGSHTMDLSQMFTDNFNVFSVKDLKVLLVNDEPLTLMILEQQMIQYIGIQKVNVNTATNGLEAYEMASCGGYDLILMDLNMPIMDGFKATKKIKDYFSSSCLFVGGGYNSDDEQNGSENLSSAPIIVALSASELDSSLTQ